MATKKRYKKQNILSRRKLIFFGSTLGFFGMNKIFHNPEAFASISESDSLTTKIVFLDSIRELLAWKFDVSSSWLCYVKSYYLNNLAGGGWFFWDLNSSKTVDGGIALKSNTSIRGRWIRIVEGDAVYASWFGARGDGKTDDSVALQSFLDSSYDNLIFDTDKTFLYNKTLFISQPKNLVGYNSQIKNLNSEIPSLIIKSSNVTISGLSIIGSGLRKYSRLNDGILIEGALSQTTKQPTTLSFIELRDITASGFGSSCIHVRYSDKVKISNVYITNTTYSGIAVYSSSSVNILNPYIDTVFPEQESGSLNAYGIAFTSNTTENDPLRYPPTKDCSVVGGTVKNIPTWHGLDTHGGHRIIFDGVAVINCRNAAVITHLEFAGAEDCTIQNCVFQNYLTEANSNGTRQQGEAIWDVGRSGQYPNKRTVIQNNTIFQHGTDKGNLIGAIFIQHAVNGKIAGNTLIEPNLHGIYLASARGYVISNNHICDVKSMTSNTVGILVGDGTSEPIENIIISNNILQKNIKAANVFSLGIGVRYSPLRSVQVLENFLVNIDSKYWFQDSVKGGIKGNVPQLLLLESDDIRLAQGTGQVEYVVHGNLVVLNLMEKYFGESVSNMFQAKQLPPHLCPSSDRVILCHILYDNQPLLGTVTVSSTGSLIFSIHNKSNSFQVNKQKGWLPMTVTYSL